MTKDILNVIAKDIIKRSAQESVACEIEEKLDLNLSFLVTLVHGKREGGMGRV